MTNVLTIVIIALIVLGVLFSLAALGGIIFLIVFLVARKNKKKIKTKANEFCNQIIEAVGGIDNIIDATAVSSRLSLTLKDNGPIDSDAFKNFVSINNIGMVKSSGKITLVIGEYASNYQVIIKNFLENKNAN